MAAGRPLAEAFVRVSPDDSGFGKKLKRQMEGAVAPAAKVIDEGLVKKLGVQIQDSNRRIQRSQLGVKDAEQGLAAARAKLTKVTQDANATDEQKAKAALAVQRAELKHADALASVGKAQDHARDSSVKLTKALRGQSVASTEVARDTTGFGRELRRALDDGVVLKQFSTLAQKLRDLKTIFNATVGPVQKFSASIAKMAVVAGAASTALLAGTGLAGGVFALAGALAATAGAAPVAATGLASLVAVFGTVKVATLGVSDGLKEVVKANSALAAGQKLTKAQTEKLAQSLAKLAPNAKAFVLEVNKLLPGLRKMQQAVQQRFFAGFAADVRDLGQRFLPTLSRAGRNLAGVLNGTVRGAIRNLLNSTTQWNLAAVLSDARKAAQDLAPGIARIPALLVNIAAAAGPAFRGLGQDASRVLSGLLDRLAGAVSSGSLTAGIDKGIAAIKQLGRIAGAVFSSIHSVVNAATASLGAGGLLKTVSDLAKRFSDFLKSAQGQEGLRRIFAGAAPVLKQLGGLLKQVGPQLASLAPVVFKLASAFLTALGPVIPVVADLARVLGGALAEVLPAVSKVAVAIGESLAGAIRILEPIIAPLADAIASLLSPTGLLNTVFGAIAPVLVVLATALATVVGIVAGAFTTAINAIGPKLPALARAFADLAVVLSTSVAAALLAIGPNLPQLAASLAQLVIAVTPLIPPLVQVSALLLQLASNVLPPLITLLSKVLSIVPPGVILVVAAMAVAPMLLFLLSLTAIGKALEWLWKKAGTFRAVVIIAFDLVKRAAATMAAGIVLWAQNIGHSVTTVVGFFRALPGRVMTALANLGLGLVRSMGGALASMRRAIVTGITSAIAWFTGLPGRIVAAVGNLGSVLFNAGKAVVQGLIDGIKSMAGAVGNAAKDVAGKVAGFFPGSPVKEGPLRVLNHGNAGRQIVRMVTGGMTAERIDLSRAFTGLAPQAGAAAGAGSNPVGGFREAFDGMTLMLRDPLGATVAGQLVTAGGRGRR